MSTVIRGHNCFLPPFAICLYVPAATFIREAFMQVQVDAVDRMDLIARENATYLLCERVESHALIPFEAP